MEKTTIMAMIAIIAALGLVGVVVITVVPIQQAEAKGCPQPSFLNPTAPGFFNSEQRCFIIPKSPHP